jgi:hypothetical protein
MNTPKCPRRLYTMSLTKGASATVCWMIDGERKGSLPAGERVRGRELAQVLLNKGERKPDTP